MARGVARVLGFHLILNFNSPYLATSLGEFWTRWHIGLSSWFRDYVYIPLGGNRAGTLIPSRNPPHPVLISRILDGAAWPFCSWGVLPGPGGGDLRCRQNGPRRRDVRAGLGNRSGSGGHNVSVVVKRFKE